MRSFFVVYVRALLAPGTAMVLLLTGGLAPMAEGGEPVVSFNSAFLRGDARSVDVSRYSDGNPVQAGDYYLDLYVNGSWKGRNEQAFRAAPGQINAHTCFSLDRLAAYGVDLATVDGVDDALEDECRSLQDWLPGATARFDNSNMRLDLTIPQANMRRQARGYVSPAFWDPGINAGFVGYNFNALHMENHGGGGDQDSAYLMINSGLNLGPWQARHDGSLSRRSGEGSEWRGTATYLRRPLPSVQGMLTLGDAYTEGSLFDSMGFRGARLASDDRMLPDSLRGYAPVVRGVAQSNALVEVRQNGQVIYRTTVSPGPFVVDDLYPTGYGGDLDVTVREADGSEQRFRVPFASVPQMLRPGTSRYSLTAGEVREAALDDEPWLVQGTYQRGLSNRLTGYAGTSISDDYQSWLGGVAVGTPVGAFSVDVTHARSEFSRYQDQRGQSYRLGYAKFLPRSGTNITVAAYRYSTTGFMSLRDAIQARDYEERGLGYQAVLRQRSQFQLTLNQSLGGRRGSLYLTGSRRDYWSGWGTTRQIQVGYNNSYRGLHYGISMLRTEDAFQRQDNRYSLNFSVPLDRISPRVSLMGSATTRSDDYESSRLGLTGSAGVDNNLVYNVAASDRADGGTSGELGAQYLSPYTALRAGYSEGRDYRQASVGASGTVVAHSGGVTVSPQRGDTMVLVEAPEAVGARVMNMSGARIDRNGYGLVPYVSPYRLNTVTLDPNDMDDSVELKTSQQQVAPYAGAVARLKFQTVSGRALLIRARRDGGRPLPFGAQVLDPAGQPVGLVGQGGVVYLRTEKEQGRLRVSWAGGEGCYIDYRLPPRSRAEAERPYLHLEARCED